MSEGKATAREQSVEIDSPRIQQAGSLRIAGLRGEYTSETRGQIPQLWQQFAPFIGRLPEQIGNVAYGVCFTGPQCKGFGYLAGVEMTGSFQPLPGWSDAKFPAGRYAVFVHRGHVSTLCETLDAIHRWLPSSSLQLAAAGAGSPVFFERYDERFCPETGEGGVEVWFPLAE